MAFKYKEELLKVNHKVKSLKVRKEVKKTYYFRPSDQKSFYTL